MNTEKLAFIKTAQRQYFEKFGERLEIDFATMNGLRNKVIYVLNTDSRNPLDPKEAEEIIRTLCEDNNITYEQFMQDHETKHNRRTSHRNVIKGYFAEALTRNWDRRQITEFIKRDRTSLYHYMKSQKHAEGEDKTSTEEVDN